MGGEGSLRREVKCVDARARAMDCFANIADTWDKMLEGFFDQALAESMVKSSGVKPGSVVVDVGVRRRLLDAVGYFGDTGKGEDRRSRSLSFDASEG